MTQQLPSNFVRQTRWAYLQDGIEVGPYDANEIVGLLGEREISPDTVLVELNTRRMCPVTEVGPFARIVVDIVKEEREKRSAREMLNASEELSSGGKRRTLLITVLVLVSLGVGGTGLFIFNPFATEKPSDGPYQGVAVAEDDDKDKEKVKKEEEEPEFAITEMDPAELEVDPETELINSVLEEKQLNPNAELLGDDEKLEGPAKIDRSKDKKRRYVRKTGPAGSEGSANAGDKEGIQTMDFSEEEIAMGDGPSGPDDGLAISRLRKVMRRCVQNSLKKFPQGEEVLCDARAQLQPDGRITSLKLNLMPRKAVGEIKMCVNAELMRMRIPAFEGDAVPLSTAVAIPGW